MNEEHIVTAFNEDMARLEAMFFEMGAIVIAQLETATRALRKEDRVLAKQVLKGDKPLNKLEADLNDLSIKILALRQPYAADLRKVVITLKSAGHLERIGDLTRNMAQRTNTITKAEADTGPIDTLIRMSEIVQDMITSVMLSYKTQNTDLATQVRAQDESVDKSHNALFREMLTYMMEDLHNISGCMHVMFIAKNIERMGDNVADIAKEVIYMNTGDWPEGKRIKSDRTSKIIIEPDDTP